MTSTDGHGASGSPLVDTITVLEAARLRRPELIDTLNLHIEILQARERMAAELEKDGSLAPGWRTRATKSNTEYVTDWEAFARLFRTICEITARYRPDQAEVFRKFMGLEVTQLQELARACLQGDLMARQPFWPDLLGFALNNALHPFLSSRRDAVLLDEYTQVCPVCGGEPDFAALEKTAGARQLLCSRCDTVWTFNRTMCPFCEEDNPAKVGYYPSSDGVYRLYVCDSCGRYLKTIDLRELARPVDLPAERILTINMDVAAQALAR